MSVDEEKKSLLGERKDDEKEAEQGQQGLAVNRAGMDMQYSETEGNPDDWDAKESEPLPPLPHSPDGHDGQDGKGRHVILPWTLAGVLALALVVMIVFLKPFEQSPQSPAVAQVNGHKIVKDDLYEMMMNQIGSQNVDAMMQQLIAEQLVHHEAEIRKLAATEADYTKQLDDIRSNFPNEEQFQAALQQAGLTLDDLKKNLTMNILLGKIVEDRVQISDEMIQTEFDAEREQYMEPDKIRASHILVDSEEKANDLLQQLQGGADFVELAIRNSTDGAAPQGGDLGYFAKGEMIPEFENVAFDLKKDEISAVVQTQYGYHIIKVTDVPKNWTLADKKEEIHQLLFDQQVAVEGNQWLEDRKASATIDIFVGSAATGSGSAAAQ